eukprot:TRINITY_DN2484_c0_g1_i1.p1 TRINITY_DN2484_c0_g1~~TRINITY_DN2484_c0_g1_i1.p1  ORF type:complete len:416 (-),score=115.93 TRINITY_DN2484_c0_g1_i1:215-1462(-)
MAKRGLILVCFVLLTICLGSTAEEFSIMNNVRGISGGDPYLVTLDGLAYNFQALGEFLMLHEVSDTGISIQARTCPYYGQSKVATMSVYCGIAVSFSGLKLSVTRSVGADFPSIFVNDYYISDNDRLDMGDFGTIFFSGSVGYNDDPYTIKALLTSLNRNITIKVLTATPTPTTLAEQFLSWSVQIPRNVSTIGLMGNNNGNPNDDLFTRDYSVTYSSLTYKQRYEEYYESYRISQDESFFYYAAGENTTTFTNRLYRGLYLSAAYSNDEIRYAQGLCSAFLLTGVLYDGCVSDVVVSGDPNLLYSYPDFTKETSTSGGLNPTTAFVPAVQTAAPGSENGDVFVIIGGALALASLIILIIFLLVLKKREHDLQKRGTWYIRNWEEEYESEDELSDAEEDGEEAPGGGVGSKTSTV